MKKYQAPGTCPICSSELKISKLKCKNCQTELSGEFEQCRFCKLSDDDMYFIEVFIKNRGNIKDVEKELSISYPTVRSKLDNVISALGFENISLKKEDNKEARKNILKQLENGEITATEAAEILKNI